MDSRRKPELRSQPPLRGVTYRFPGSTRVILKGSPADVTSLDLVVLLLRAAALVWSVVLLRRLQDWRMGLLSLLIGFMTARLIFSPIPAAIDQWSMLGLVHEGPELALSLISLAVVVFLGRSLGDQRRAAAALRIEKAYFEHLFENAPEALVLADHHSVIERVNGEFTRLFGYAGAEVVGQSLDEMLAPHALAEARTLTSESANGRTIRFETQRRRRDARPAL